MPQSLFPAPNSPEFWLVVYSYALGAAGLASMLLLPVLVGGRKERVACDLRPWSLGILDFGILIWLLFFWTVVAAGLGRWLLGGLDPDGQDTQIWRSVLGDLISQSGLAAIFLAYRFFMPYQVRVPLSTRSVPLPIAVLKGLLFFLAVVPPIWLLGALWSLFLTWLNSLGLDLNVKQQTIVDYFGQAHSPWAYIALLTLAIFIAPLVEELIFRGGIYRFLKSRMSPAWAGFWGAALFAALHFNLLSFPSLLLLGGALTLAYEVTGSIRVAIAFHALFNLNTILLITLTPKPV